jgi:hypothetical protein
MQGFQLKAQTWPHSPPYIHHPHSLIPVSQPSCCMTFLW